MAPVTFQVGMAPTADKIVRHTFQPSQSTLHTHQSANMAHKFNKSYDNSPKNVTHGTKQIRACATPTFIPPPVTSLKIVALSVSCT